MSFSTAQSIALYLFQKLDFLNEYMFEYINGEIYLNGYRIKKIYHQDTFIGIKFILGIYDFFKFDPDEFKDLIKNLDDFKLVFNGFYKFLTSYYFQTYIHDKSEKTINEIKRFMRNKKFRQNISNNEFQISDYNYRCKFKDLFPYSFMINLLNPSTIEIYIKTFRLVDKYKNKIMKIHLEEKYKNNNKKINLSQSEIISLYLANRYINNPVNIRIIDNELFMNDYLFRKTDSKFENIKKYISIFPIESLEKYKLIDLSNILTEPKIFELTVKIFNKFLNINYEQAIWPDDQTSDTILLRKLMPYYNKFQLRLSHFDLELVMNTYHFKIQPKRIPEISLYKLSFYGSEFCASNLFSSKIILIRDNGEIKIKVKLYSEGIKTDYIRKMCRIDNSQYPIVNINDFPFEIGYTELNNLTINNYEFVIIRGPHHLSINNHWIGVLSDKGYSGYRIQLKMENFNNFRSQNFVQIFKYEYVSRAYNFLMYITENILMFDDLYSLLTLDDYEYHYLIALRDYLISFFNLNAYLLRDHLIVRLDNSLELEIEIHSDAKLLIIKFKLSRNYSIYVYIYINREEIIINLDISNRFVKDEYNSLLHNRIKRE